MPQPDVRKYLFDVLQACDLLAQFTAGKRFDDYTSDALLRSAVERQFEIVGEPLNQGLRVDPGLAARITDSGRIISFRHRLSHGYASISDKTVWGILETYLPLLRREVKALLDELGTEP
jgi:uncharacterized protein with HEPN domain